MSAQKLGFIQNGVELDDIKDYISHETYYKHKDMCNVKISGPNDNAITLPTKDIMDIFKMWGIQKYYSGIFTVSRKLTYNDIRLNAEVFGQKFKTSYECNSRKVLKELNELERIITAHSKLANTDIYEGSSGAPTQLLLIAGLINDPNRAVHLLKGYKIYTIIKRIKSAEFRHIYKIVHPDTTFNVTELHK